MSYQPDAGLNASILGKSTQWFVTVNTHEQNLTERLKLNIYFRLPRVCKTTVAEVVIFPLLL